MGHNTVGAISEISFGNQSENDAIFLHHLEREQTHFKNHYKKQLAGANRDKKNTFTSELNYIYRQKNLNKHIV